MKLKTNRKRRNRLCLASVVVSMTTTAVLWLSLFFPAPSYARAYKNYLSIRDAERSLASIVQHPRLSRDEWLSLLGEKKDITYTVQPGDTLWRISQKTFGDPFLWRKLWQVNEQIANPHDIEPGRVLAYYRGTAEGEVPIIKLVPPDKGRINDLDNDIVIQQSWVSRIRILHFLLPSEEIVGEITGSYSDKDLLSTTDRVYMQVADPTKAKVGDIISVAREEKLVPNKQMPVIEGSNLLMRLLGNVEIVEVGDQFVIGEIKEAFDVIERGNKLVNEQKTVMRTVAKAPPNDLYALIVSGEIPERRNFGQGELLLLNRGLKHGMQEGYLFRVYQDTDPSTKSRTMLEPHFKGEIQIMYAAQEASIGYVLRSETQLSVGDVLLPPQHFTTPKKRVYRQATQIELDE